MEDMMRCVKMWRRWGRWSWSFVGSLFGAWGELCGVLTGKLGARGRVIFRGDYIRAVSLG